MSTYEFDIPAFRVSYPAYANETVYPDETLQAFWDSATCYIRNLNWGRLRGDCRYKAITLMTAHLAYISGLITANQVPGLAQQATVGQVSVTLTPPPLKNQWQQWLCISPYGQQLLALLQVKSAGGFFTGGNLTRFGFRGPAGGFP